MTVKVKLAFVGPMPPPLGGVAVINRSIQSLFCDKYGIELFNTSRGSKRENLYGRRSLISLIFQAKLFFGYIFFILNTKSKIINIFTGSHFAFFRGFYFLIVSKIFLKKIVLHVHGKIAGEFFVSDKMLPIYGYMLSKADVVVLLSADHLERFGRYLSENTEVIILENFVDSVQLRPGMPADEVEFLFVGRLSEEKGIYDLIGALNLIVKKNVRFNVNLIGLAETDSAHDALLNELRRQNLEDVVTLHGALEGEAKYKLFRRCPVLIFTSHFENSPVVLKEALAAGQIIISSDISANKKTLKNSYQNSIFFYKCKDVDDLAAKIINVMDDYADLKLEFPNIQCPQNSTMEYAFKTLSECYSRLN